MFSKYELKKKLSKGLGTTIVEKYKVEIDDYIDSMNGADEELVYTALQQFICNKFTAKPKKKKECELCGGSGVLDDPVWDEDSKSYHPTGSRKCDCQL
jgi:hypothetical protein